MTAQSTREIRVVVVAPGLLLATMVIRRAVAVPARGILAAPAIQAIQAMVIIMAAAAKQIHRQAVAVIIMAAGDRLLDRSPLGNDS